MASPDVHSHIWSPGRRLLGQYTFASAQKCSGCGQAFMHEKAFGHHAPCHQPATGSREHLSGSDGDKTGQEDKVKAHAEEDITPLNDFEAQLLAAANDTSSKEIQAEKQSPMLVQALNKGANTSKRNVGAGISRTESPHARICYGCGKGFWDSQRFWNHDPCFTTIAKTKPSSVSVPRNPPDTSSKKMRDDADLSLRCMAPNAQKHSPINAEQANNECVTVKGKEREIPENVTNEAPSPEVQRLLVALAQNNPEARPIPPAELHDALHRGSYMLALASRMEEDNGILQHWLEHRKGDTLEQVSKSKATVAPRPSSKQRKRMLRTCKEETMANILCYAKPGEDLDWTKTEDRAERARLQNIIKGRKRRERELHRGGRSGSGGDYPGAEGVRGFLSQRSGSEQHVLGQCNQSREVLNASVLERELLQYAALEKQSRRHSGLMKTPQHHSLTTVTGLKLRDATDHDFEQFIEEVDP